LSKIKYIFKGHVTFLTVHKVA